MGRGAEGGDRRKCGEEGWRRKGEREGGRDEEGEGWDRRTEERRGREGEREGEGMERGSWCDLAFAETYQPQWLVE